MTSAARRTRFRNSPIVTWPRSTRFSKKKKPRSWSFDSASAGSRPSGSGACSGPAPGVSDVSAILGGGGAGRGQSLLIQRVITGAIFGIVVIAGVLLLPTSGTAALLALLFVAGAWEWAGLARLTAPLRAASAALLAAVALLGYAWTGERSVVIPLLLVAAAFWAVALAAVLSFPRRLPLAAVGAAGVFVLLPPWAALVHLHGATPKGPGLVMAVIAIVWAADVGAFFTGRAIGRHKLAPQVSPGKT